jgi:hypothetical protein
VKKLRNLQIGDRAPTSFRLDELEWRAIDRAAEGAGVSWQEWARTVLQAHPGTNNKTAVLRAAATKASLDELSEAGRKPIEQVHHPMLVDRLTLLSADQVRDELAYARVVFRSADLFRGFELIAAYHDDIPVLLIRDRVEGGLSALVSKEPVSD